MALHVGGWIIAATIAFTILANGCGDEPVSLGDARLEIVGGTNDTEHHSVVAITTPQNPNPSYCTATLITPTVAVTAGHCVIDAHAHDAVLSVYFGDAIGDGGQSIPVLEYVADPAFSETQNNSARDVGLLLLASPAPVAPMPFGAAPVDAEAATLIGFGYDTTNETGIGTRRERAETISDVTATDFELLMSGSCNGDSGGAVLVDGDRGPVLVGVHSQGTCGGDSREARLDTDRDDFIVPFVNAHATCDADGACALDCAAPDPDCPCLADGFCTSACADVASDPDCDPKCGADGECATDCPIPDVDCSATTGAGGGGAHKAPSKEQDAGCSITFAGAHSDGALSWLCASAIAIGLLRRRRAAMCSPKS